MGLLDLQDINPDYYRDHDLTPAQAKVRIGATHYGTMRDGVTPQMYYKYDREKHTLQYRSFCNLWQGSNLNGEGRKFEDLLASLIEIKD